MTAGDVTAPSTSLSARRAWIEMVAACPFSCWGAVALRKESVDRNTAFLAARVSSLASLSARRAWIEMSMRRCLRHPKRSLSARRAWIEMGENQGLGSGCTVALRKESVDRNFEFRCSYLHSNMCRSPQGERG